MVCSDIKRDCSATFTAFNQALDGELAIKYGALGIFGASAKVLANGPLQRAVLLARR